MLSKFNSRYFLVFLSAALALVLISPYVIEQLPIYTEGHYHRHAWALGQLSIFDENSSFFWRPRFLFGAPRFSNPLTINYYPVTYLRHFISEPFFSQILWFLSFFLGFIGAQKLFKLKIESDSLSFTGGLIFSMSGIMMISAFKGQLVEQLPFTVWFFYFYLSGIIENDLRKVFVAAIINSLHLLATETQFLWFYTTTFIPFVGIYFFYIKQESLKEKLVKFVSFNLCLIIPTILMTAILVLPVMELQGLYIPPLYDDMSIYRLTGRFNPLELRYSPFAFPGIFKHHLGFGRLRMYINLSYLGIIPLIVCIYYFLNVSHLKKIALLIFTYFIFSAASSFGPGNDLLRLIPHLTDLRYSSHWLFAWNLTLCFVFCLGLKRLNTDRELKKVLIIGASVFVSLFLAFGYWYFRQDNLDNYVLPINKTEIFEIIRPFIFTIGFLLAVGAAFLKKLKLEKAIALILMISVLDIFSWVFHVPRLYSKALFDNKTFVKCLKSKKDYKKFGLIDTPPLGEGRSIRFDVGSNCFFDFLNAEFEMVRPGTTLTLERPIRIAKYLGWVEGGFHNSSFTKDFLSDENKIRLARLLNIKYYFSKDALDEKLLREIGFKLRNKLTDYNLNLYEDIYSKKRIQLFNSIKRVQSKDEALESLLKSKIDYFKQALVENLPDDIEIDSGAEGSIEDIKYQPLSISLRVSSNGKMLLFLSDSHYPGWKAFINGKETRIFHTNYMGRGIVVPSGKNKIEFKFESSTFKLGFLLTLFGLLGSLLAIAFMSYRRTAPKID